MKKAEVAEFLEAAVAGFLENMKKNWGIEHVGLIMWTCNDDALYSHSVAWKGDAPVTDYCIGAALGLRVFTNDIMREPDEVEE